MWTLYFPLDIYLFKNRKQQIKILGVYWYKQLTTIYGKTSAGACFEWKTAIHCKSFTVAFFGLIFPITRAWFTGKDSDWVKNHGSFPLMTFAIYSILIVDALLISHWDCSAHCTLTLHSHTVLCTFNYSFQVLKIACLILIDIKANHTFCRAYRRLHQWLTVQRYPKSAQILSAKIQEIL